MHLLPVHAPPPCAGYRLQDEAAEDPLLAAEAGLVPNLDLYWNNKLKAGLARLPCLIHDVLVSDIKAVERQTAWRSVVYGSAALWQ